MKKKMEFTECGGDRKRWSAVVRQMTVVDEESGEKRLETDKELAARAVKKIWGASAFLWSDSGLGPDYGQICKPMGGRCFDCITGRIRASVEERP